MPTRSTKLASLKPAAGVATAAFLVPAGFTYLVKSVLSINPSGGPDTIFVYAQDAGGLPGSIRSALVLPAGGRDEWEGWVALNPGESLFVNAVNGATNFWISGTKLPGVA